MKISPDGKFNSNARQLVGASKNMENYEAEVTTAVLHAEGFLSAAISSLLRRNGETQSQRELYSSCNPMFAGAQLDIGIRPCVRAAAISEWEARPGGNIGSTSQEASIRERRVMGPTGLSVSECRLAGPAGNNYFRGANDGTRDG